MGFLPLAPMITPDSVELAVQVGAVDNPSLWRLFGLEACDPADIEALYDGLAVLVQIGRLTSHVEHEDGPHPRAVYVPTRRLDFTGDPR